jgi:rare lipoprotein A
MDRSEGVTVAEPDRDDGYFEIQLDRGTVALSGLGVVALLVLSFLLGSGWGRSDATPDAAPDAAPAAAVGGEAAAPGPEPLAPSAVAEDEDVDGEPLFGDTTVSARGAPPVAPVPAGPAPEAKPPGPAGRTTQAAASRPAAATTPRPPSPAGAAATPPPAASGWVVQVGALNDARDAQALARRLTAKGYPVRVQEARGLHKVQVGPFAARGEAESVERRLKAEEKLATWLHQG